MQSTTVETGVTPKSGEEPYKSPSRQTYEKLAKEFRGFTKASAESIIKRAEILVKAKKELSENKLTYSFEKFCEELLGLDAKHSTVRKWLAIGEKASRFYPVLEHLTDNWTTIYTLAQLSDEQFERVVKDERFGPKMKAKEVDDICPPMSKKKAKGGSGIRAKKKTSAAAKSEPTINEMAADDDESEGTPIPPHLLGEPVGTDPTMIGEPAGDELEIVLRVNLADLDGEERRDLHERLVALKEDFAIQVSGDVDELLIGIDA